ncbi:MAG: multiheme c-type cytochrome [Phycisphaerae bacterium]|jgi:tetratricopeptide (TPR) repeat protein
MRSFFTKRRIAVGGICILVVVFANSYAELTPEKPADAGYEQGLMHYEHNEIDKAIKSFKESLSLKFTEPAPANLQQAIDLAKNGKADEAEKALLSLLDDEKTAARARYELGLIYESKGKLDDAATMFRNSLLVIANKGASYVGIDKCKMCHIKQYNSWKTTKMAKTFDVLKPAASAEAKTKFKLDPQKDYTTDAKCLECHTTGFGMPGGYKIPQAGDLKDTARAKANEGTTCESCHGPGSKFVVIHKDVMMKKRKHTLDELYKAGQRKVDAGTCTACHNQRNPVAEPDYHFDYEKHKSEDTHENFPLLYRQ